MTSEKMTAEEAFRDAWERCLGPGQALVELRALGFDVVGRLPDRNVLIEVLAQIVHTKSNAGVNFLASEAMILWIESALRSLAVKP